MQGGLALFLAFSVLLQLEFPRASSSLAKFNHSGKEPVVLRCIEREREALLAFKQGFVENDDSREVFSSWGTQIHKRECCKWEGVQCNNATGHVIQLELGGWPLQGKMISSKLIELQHLEYLDLSWIEFNGTQFPHFIASLTNLRHLDLSFASFGGQIPSKLGNLTHLQYLDLSNNHFQFVKNLNWLRPLSSLTYLDLSGTNLSVSFDWSEVVTRLPKLQNLTLMGCGLPSPPIHSYSEINSSKSLIEVHLSDNFLTSSIFPWLLSNYNPNTNTLVDLDLSENYISGSIPDAVGNMTSLVFLDLSDSHVSGSFVFGNMSSLVDLDLSNNQIEGANPNSFARLCSLQSLDLSNNSLSGQVSKFVHQLLSPCAQNALAYLDLSENHLTGSLPNLTNFLSLEELRLHSNQLRGRVPESIGQLSRLQEIDLHSNFLEGVISETHFSRLSKLTSLELSFNSLVSNLSSDWIPPFQLEYLDLRSCKLFHSHFPKWIQTQQLTYLDISDTGISDVIPSGLWENLLTQLSFMNLSNNQIRGTIENLTITATHFSLDLSSNQLEGSVPSNLSNALNLDLSSNRMFGSISSFCATTGSSILFLGLSSNNFSGEFPDCFMHFQNLIMLDLSNNSFSGKIPSTIGSLFQIETLKLRGNKFVGELPSSLTNCTSLKALDVGHNELSGPLPKWLAVSFPNLVILMLSSNHFNGSIPFELCHMSQIQILDLSVNNISGIIPNCIKNLTALTQKGSSSPTVSHDKRVVYDDSVNLLWKGNTHVYTKTLGLVKSLDLSSNGLSGKIPSEITRLVGLISLNLSRNQLTSQLPPDIGKLDSLDSLNLSRNRIDGRIPTSLAQIYHLGLLDLSYNNLSGKIPTGTQLQSFNSSVYAGNTQLCGPPLTKMCDWEQTVVSNEDEDKEDDDELIPQGFYMSMAVGFAVAFWGVCGSLMINRAWRHAYFNLLNDFNDWFYVRVALIKQKFKDRYA